MGAAILIGFGAERWFLFRKKWNGGQLKVWGKHICTIVRGIEQSDYLGNFFRKEISSLVLLKSRKVLDRLRVGGGAMIIRK